MCIRDRKTAKNQQPGKSSTATKTEVNISDFSSTPLSGYRSTEETHNSLFDTVFAETETVRTIPAADEAEALSDHDIDKIDWLEFTNLNE